MKRYILLLLFAGCCDPWQSAVAQDWPATIGVPQRGYQVESITIPERQVQIARPLPPIQYHRAGFAVIPPRVATIGPLWFSPDAGWCPRCRRYHPIQRRVPVYLPAESR